MTRQSTCCNKSPGLARALAMCLLIMMMFPGWFASSYAAAADSGDTMPHVGKNARENFTQYRYAGENRAFAIAPGGAWAWYSDATSEAEAEQIALQRCQSYTKQKCVLYALNDRIVFDADKWPTLWGPYADDRAASSAVTGIRVGERFHDLSWQASGKTAGLSDYRGKLVVLHFWGSWCPPCLREFPSLSKLYQKVRGDLFADVEMIMLQLREPFSVSRKWAEEYGFSDLPLFDSGADTERTTLQLSNGGSISDRQIARVFPSTYVLDRNGLVIFSHYGPVTDWLEYLPFLEHAVAGTISQKSRESRASVVR